MDILMWVYDRLLNPNLFSHHTTNCRQATTAVPGDYCQGNKDFSFKPESLPLSAPQPSERHMGTLEELEGQESVLTAMQMSQLRAPRS